MKKRAYYYPPASRGGYSNSYSANYKRALGSHFEVLDKDNKPALALGLSFFFNAFRADIYVINWLESVVFLKFGYLQYVLARCGLWIIKSRKKRIVWMFHNIHPHSGENVYSKRLQAALFGSADLVISHSREAAAYAQGRAKGEVLYACHPVEQLHIVPKKANIASDVLIWGAISPYKGVKEFLHELQKRKDCRLKVHIVGKCCSRALADEIRALCSPDVLFEERHVPFEELAGLVEQAKFVLFPYVGDSVSSSGALIDTIVLGGCPVGPDKGAFKDLAAEGVCIVYKDYDGLFSLLQRPAHSDKAAVATFIRRNSWTAFVDFLVESIKMLK